MTTIALLTACADAPTAPLAATTIPTSAEAPPSEVVAASNTLFELGMLSGFANGGVNAINTSGETAGWNNLPGGAYHAFIRGLDGTMTDLGTLGGTGSVALGMNDSKTVVGLSYLGGNVTYHAFASEISGAKRILTDLPVPVGTVAASTRCAAYGINDNGGSIVGFCFAANGKQHAVRWTRASAGVYTILDLQPLTGWTSSFAYDINDNGVVVGFGMQTSGAMRGFKYVPQTALAGTMTSIGTFPGGSSSSARAINNNGDIVGWGTTSTGETHALGIYTASPATVYDGGATLTGPSYAFDINDNGQAVGWAQPSAGVFQPLYWNLATTPVDLGTSVTTTSAQAFAINDRGQVVGTTGSLAAMWFTTTNSNPVANPGGPYSFARSGGKVVVAFNGSASSDVDGDLISSYSWRFSDDGSTATGVSPTHTYTAKGNFTVTLTVTDWRGGVSTPVQVAVKITS